MQDDAYQAAVSANDLPDHARRDEWLYAPDLPIGNNPLFEWPLNARRVIAYHRDSSLTLSEVSLFFAAAIATWLVLRGPLNGATDLFAAWMFYVWGVNLGLVFVVAGGFHLFFYSFRMQGTALKYVPQFGHRGGARFTFGNQLRDNMFWSLASGVTVWTAYLVGLL